MRCLKITVLIVGTFVFAYPVASLTTHGLRPAFWPEDSIPLAQWFERILSGQIGAIFVVYWEMALGKSEVFSDGGAFHFWLLMSPAVCGAVCIFGSPREQLRDASGIYGSARFADTAAVSRLDHGLELGIASATGKPVRVDVEGTLVSFAPPRAGKTWGLLIPNLLFAEPSAWSGSAVVLDTKGEVYRAVLERRRALGRRVVCLDPVGLVRGVDRWNPFAKIDHEDVLSLQRAALALLPESSDSEASAYFRNRAVDLLVGAMDVAIRQGSATPARVRDLLDSEEHLTAELRRLERYPVARAALAIMESDPRTRDPIRSTAMQAFQWLADPRLVTMTSRTTFALSDMSGGDVDLFIVIPPESRRILAPLLRWILSDLFAAIRRRRPVERLLVLVDEAAALGRFEDILTAANELPGYGVSLWSFWQNRSQLVEMYGETGAATLINTAEVVTVSNVSAADPQETDRWSQVLGEYTALVTSRSASPGCEGETTTRTPQAARVLPPSGLSALPQDELIALIRNARHNGRPMRLRKTKTFGDPRYRRFVKTARPVGTTGARRG